MNNNKHCPGCKQILPVENFHKNKARKDGLAVHCKSCKSSQDKKYAAANKDKIRNKYKRWYQLNTQRIYEYNKIYVANNRDAVKAYKTKWENANRKYKNEKNRIWRENNKEYMQAYSKKWGQENKEAKRKYANKRRALILGRPVDDYTEMDVLLIYGTDCHICNEPINLLAPRQVGKSGWEVGLHIEHLVSIFNGGSDTLDNVRPSHGLCNLKKGCK